MLRFLVVPLALLVIATNPVVVGDEPVDVELTISYLLEHDAAAAAAYLNEHKLPLTKYCGGMIDCGGGSGAAADQVRRDCSPGIPEFGSCR